MRNNPLKKLNDIREGLVKVRKEIDRLISDIDGAAKYGQSHCTTRMKAMVKGLCVDVAKDFGVAASLLFVQSRKGALVDARCIAMTLCTELFGTTREQVGAMFNHDQSTVSHAIKRTQDLCEVDKNFRERFSRIRIAMGNKYREQR